ncbi:MAG: zinc-finger domain-containing protein [Rhodobacteraceae bacterium]|nr:zinc-finger domain-containing protein [Paracoccaceae bacterium]
MTIEAPETEEVTVTKVKCDGNGDHPRVWLIIPRDTGFVECGYCDKKFVLKK